jgi:hypothetical protein
MWAKIKSLFRSFTASFHDSETILIARIKLFLGMGFTAIQTSGVDIASLFVTNLRWQAAIRVFFAWLIVDGTLTEWARRNRNTDLEGPRDTRDDHLDPGKP